MKMSNARPVSAEARLNATREMYLAEKARHIDMRQVMRDANVKVDGLVAQFGPYKVQPYHRHHKAKVIKYGLALLAIEDRKPKKYVDTRYYDDEIIALLNEDNYFMLSKLRNLFAVVQFMDISKEIESLMKTVDSYSRYYSDASFL